MSQARYVAPLQSPYQGRTAVLATKHQKEAVLGPLFHEGLGLRLIVPADLNTDLLGTFSGEIPRPGSPREVLIKKARWGMKVTGLSLGIASEGSFGPAPDLPFMSVDHEMLAFIDDELGIQIVEQIVSPDTNFGSIAVRSVDDLTEFLSRCGFPEHGLIVRPNVRQEPDMLFKVFKGITTLAALQEAIAFSAGVSADGRARVETDMRAHMNPTRQRVLQQLGTQLVRRLASRCPACGIPGWGLVDVLRGLPCQVCGEDTDWVKQEIWGCARCEHQEARDRSDGLTAVGPEHCRWCNP